MRAASLVWTVLLIPALVHAGDKDGELTRAEVARRGKAATALVEVPRGRDKVHGSAFCVHPSGLFITNEHVVRGAAEVSLVLDPALKTQKVVKAKAVRTDAVGDLALLRAEGVSDLPVLPLGSDDDAAELTEVIAVGFPFGDRLKLDDGYPAVSVNVGNVTSLRRKDGKLNRIQVDVALNPGNSGGAVLDRKGKVVGVVVAGVSGARLNLLIPVSQAAEFLAAPDVRLTTPTITPANQHEPAEFRAVVASVVPPSKPPSVELVLRAGDGRERRFPMKGEKDVYRVSAVPVPADETRRLDLSAQFEGGAVTGSVADRDVRVGTTTVKLSTLSRFRREPRPTVVLRDGKTLDGAPVGLDKVAFEVAGQTLTVDLGKATAWQVEVPRPATGVDCTVIARQGDREVGRAQARVAIRGAVVVAPADPGGGTIRPPKLGTETVVKTLPESASDIRVGGGGRYLVLHLPKLKKLAVFDVNEGSITRYIPLTEDRVVYAPGMDKLVVGLTAKGVLERWDLRTGEKELSRPAPGGEEVGSVLMGSASRGPVLVNGGFVDLDTLRPLPVRLPSGIPPYWGPVSADGTVFGAWKSNQSPTETTTFVLEGEELKRYNEGGTGHVAPGPDGRVVYTAQGPRTNQLKGVSGGPAKAVYCIPATEGDFYLVLTPAEGGGAGTMAVHLMGNEVPLVRDVGFGHGIRFDSWDRQLFGPWKRIYFIPRAQLIVVFPESNDRLELHRFDLDGALEKSGLDYLLVTSRPPLTAKRGAEFEYQVAVKSKKGGVKVTLASGPEGMTVSPTGLVKWRVPADFKGGESNVVLTVRDGSDQEVFHTFTLRIGDR